ncbi:hypothetical protein NDI54_07730 [Haloarcula sp. S1AR25-5A]|uniref:Uncharacterized protein n=1 Tax=Haloarcula terrestris TaxID=2950533 RepID=A0AAE4EW19_9EURY|nr:hypothetical protein [Haloarcula terrestris]MDS0221235.1 hypothetical protein [Haloarcula terrestris]
MPESPTADTSASEQLSYRLRKWLLQRATSMAGADQHQRIAAGDWDVLLVLDACRLDTCRDAVDWPVQEVTTPASCTPDWLTAAADRGLFAGKTVLTANPQYQKFEFEADSIEHFWQSHWDERRQTVLPGPVLDRVTEHINEDSSPVIAHLQQPHWPYVARIDDEWELAYPDLGPWTDDGEEIAGMQVAMARGKIDVERAYSAYRASVRSIWRTLLPAIESWVADGHTVVVTADHGEVFGRLTDATMYEHPCKVGIRPLTAVPWVEFDSSQPETVDDGTVQDRLEALGYAE